MRKQNNRQQEEITEQLLKQMTRPKERKPKTVGRILMNKFLFYLEDEDLCRFLSGVIRFIAFVAICLCLYFPEEARQLATKILEHRDNFLIKAVMTAAILYFLTHIIDLIILICRKLYVYFLALSYAREMRKESTTHQESEDSRDRIMSVPVDEIVEHLFSHQSFKRTECEKKFLLPRRKYTALAKKLEEVGILERGENNARVLNPLLSREQVSEMLIGKNDIEEIDELWKSPTLESGFTLQKIS